MRKVIILGWSKTVVGNALIVSYSQIIFIQVLELNGETRYHMFHMSNIITIWKACEGFNVAMLTKYTNQFIKKELSKTCKWDY